MDDQHTMIKRRQFPTHSVEQIQAAIGADVHLCVVKKISNAYGPRLRLWTEPPDKPTPLRVAVYFTKDRVVIHVGTLEHLPTVLRVADFSRRTIPFARIWDAARAFALGEPSEWSLYAQKSFTDAQRDLLRTLLPEL